MAKPEEHELKVMLTKEQFETLLHAYDFPILLEQINTYYDTPKGAVKDLPGAVRIRRVDGKDIFTFKQRKDSQTQYELEKEIPVGSLDQIEDPEILGWLQEAGIDVKVLKPITTFTTWRHMIKTENAEICLDKTVYPHKTDYEIEYEYKKDHDGLSAFNQFLKPAGIIYEKNGPSKIARAFTH